MAKMIATIPKSARGPSLDTTECNLEELLKDYIKKIIDKHEKSFEEFYDATIGRARHLIRRIVNDSHEIEDILEEAYWQVWRNANQYVASKGSVLSWFLIICRSRALDYLRRKEPFELYAEIDENQSFLSEASSPSAYDVLEVIQQNTLVAQALEKLTPQERQLISLAFFKDLSHQQIATHTNLPLGTVKTALKRAYGKLTKQLIHHI